MLSNKIQNALNKQLNAELYSAYLYLSMSAYYQSINLPGFANWMFVQMQEEQAHAQIIYNHIVDRGGRVVLTAIEAPPTDWTNPPRPFEDALAHEQQVTAMINKLVDLSIQESDHAAAAMLQWFVNEQVEEEKNTGTVAQQLKLIGDAPAALLLLDRELGARVYTPPAILTGAPGGATA